MPKKISRRKALALVTAGALTTAGGIYLLARNQNEIKEAKNSDETDRQIVLNRAYAILEPEHISQIIYDPDSIHFRRYLKAQLRKTSINEQEITALVDSAERNTASHLLSIAGVAGFVGDKEKRPVFAKEELFSSPLISSINDIVSCLRHENAHAEAQRLGYDFGNRKLYGAKLSLILSERKIRPEVLNILAEIPALAIQFQAITEKKDKVSAKLYEKTKKELRTAKEVCERQLKKGNFTDLEAQYITHHFEKYKATIDKAYR